MTIKFCLCEIVMAPNWALNKQFWILGSNLHKMSVYGLKQIK